MKILLVLLAAWAKTCPKIDCGLLNYPKCSSSNLTYFNVSSCLPEETCDYQTQGKVQKCAPALPRRFSGDFCALDEECISGICVLGICYSNNLLEDCQDTLDCNVGLYCDGLVCQNQKKEGASCSKDYECANSLMCNLGICVGYWSREKGEEVEEPVNGLSLACKSGGAVQDISGVWHCGIADNSTSLNNTCDPDAPCKSFSNLYTQECTCGGKKDGSAFCGLFPGDQIVIDAINDAQTIFGLNSYCNTHSRFSLYCFLAHTSNLTAFLKFAYNYQLSFGGFYPKTLQADDDCHIQTISREFYEIKKSLESQSLTHICPAYYCPADGLPSEDQCSLTVNDSNFGVLTNINYANPICEWDSYCNQDGECENKTSHLGFPGDFCNETDTYDCTVKCHQGFCLGIRENEICDRPEDCMPGFFCNQTSKVCEKLKYKSGACRFDYECSNYLLCNLGSCINYFSLDNNENTDICELDSENRCLYSFACSSGFAYSSTTPGQYICATAPSSQKSNPCLYAGQPCSDKDGKYYHTCSCSMKEVFNGNNTPVYCPPFAGDNYFQNVIVNLNLLLNWNQVCNTRSRLSLRCFLRSNEYLGYYFFYITNLTMFVNYTKMYEVQDCIKKVYSPQEYLNEQYLKEWVKKNNGKNHDHDDSWSQYLVVSAYSLIILFS